MDIAAKWYTSTIFWVGAGVVVALLAAIASLWAALTVGFPRRRLFMMPTAAPLLRASANMRSRLEIRHRGTLLTNPYGLTVKIISRGRKDIPSEAYNDHQPLRLDVGADIVDVLQTTSEPEALAPPQIATDGTSLKIGPSLIGKRHKITITVLTDGGEPFLTCQSPLIDVQVEHRTDEPQITSLLPSVSLVSVMLVERVGDRGQADSHP